MAVGTAAYSVEEEQQRKLLFGLIICVVCFCLLVLGVLISILSRRWAPPSIETASAEVLGLEGNRDEAAQLLMDPETTESVVRAHAQEIKHVGKHHDEDKERVDDSGAIGRVRHFVLAFLFCCYVSCCIGIPLYSFSSLSCGAGMYWEHHMVFLLVFVATKLCEMEFYARARGLQAPLPAVCGEGGLFGITQGFMFKYVMSFTAYFDAYQDATSIAIAFSCPSPTARALAWAMLITYVLGVMVAQWVVSAWFAFWDPSSACMLKLLHMDSVASRVVIPEEQKFTWRLIQSSRTIAEDLPQAVLQLVYVTQVKSNYFMIFSIACAAGASLMAMKDAFFKAIGARNKQADMRVCAVHVGSGWAIHAVVFESTTKQVWGRIVHNDGSDLPLNSTNYLERRSAELSLEPNEWIIQVSGYRSLGGYLCYELSFHTNKGRTLTHSANQSAWQGDQFEFVAPPNEAIVELEFDGGACIRVKTCPANWPEVSN